VSDARDKRLDARGKQLVASVIPTARRYAEVIARKRDLEADELFSVMMEHTIQCVPTYDASRGTFENYAWKRMSRAAWDFSKTFYAERAKLQEAARRSVGETSVSLEDGGNPLMDDEDATLSLTRADFALLAAGVAVSLAADEQLALAEQRQALRDAIAALRPDLRVVADLRYLQDVAPEEVAAKLDVSTATERRLNNQAVRRLGIDLRSRLG
jgi:RNA polymerase sigma factor (sigma-70 family)